MIQRVIPMRDDQAEDATQHLPGRIGSTPGSRLSASGDHRTDAASCRASQ